MAEIYNGGISLGIGDYTLKVISSYEPKWVFETEGEFENWDFSTVEIVKGKRFSASVSTGVLPEAEANKLLTVLKKRTFTFKSPEFEGTVRVSDIPKKYNSANVYGVFCSVSFTVAAVSLEGTSGSL